MQTYIITNPLSGMKKPGSNFYVRSCGLLRHLYIPSIKWLIRNDISADGIKGLFFYYISAEDMYKVSIICVGCNNRPCHYLLSETTFHDKSNKDSLIRHATRLKEVNYEQVSNS